PQGAFYLFAKVSSYYGKKTKDNSTITNSIDFANYLLEEAKVAVVPGVAFGNDEFIRISYATSEKKIEEACIRIKRALKELY
ncbi:MAG: aminotransferase class I/II-fold pyridoxal phosphate-dependent enzyme, partial [Caldimicrobium sp.]